MVIQNMHVARDGGSRHIETDEGFFFIDYRIGSDTRGLVFSGHSKSGGQLISDQDGILMLLEEAFRVFKIQSHFRGELLVPKHLLRP